MKGFIVAFSIYSKIPMPQSEWKDEDMKYSLCFFPFVGVVIAALMVGWHALAMELSVGYIFRLCVMAAIPILVTGGFHVDGYMDYMDAMHSYKSKEDKLKILSDPHIGAFSVIMLVLYYILFIGTVSEVNDHKKVLLLGGGFVLSRIFSAFMVIHLKPAKESGMFRYFSDTASKHKVTGILVAEFIILTSLMSIFVSAYFLFEVLAVLLFSIYYRYKCYKELGGVTGDTAGFFVTMAELLAALTIIW